MILTIDVGNTNVKSAVIEKDSILERLVFSLEEIIEKIEKILQQHPEIVKIVLASVGNLEIGVLERLRLMVDVHVIERDDAFPFINAYATPETLGIDRMVLAAGAVLRFPNCNRLVIDAGTCVTYDFIDANNVYHGGAISPGIRLRYEAMHNYTAKLPLLSLEEPQSIAGDSTKSAMHSGVVNGLSYEIDGFISGLKKDNQNFIIILTGGDAIFLAKRLKNSIFANSNFLLESLSSLYQYQIENV